MNPVRNSQNNKYLFKYFKLFQGQSEISNGVKNDGFTLIEILVVTGIVVFLSAIILVNYQSSSQQLSLQRSAHKLAQDIRRAQELAMSAKEFQGAVPQGGYGIHFKTSWENFYKLYADTNGNEKYDGADGEIETVYLEKDVYVQNISPSSLSINFKPPNPTIRIKTEAGGDSVNVLITLSLQSEPTRTRIIKVNIVGLIDIE